MEKIDVKDRKMLYYLHKDARLTDTRLASLVGLSKNAVKYRRERLIGRGIIRNFSAVVNLDLLGYSTVIVLFKFNKDVYSDTELLEYFKKHPFSDWVMTLSGGFDVLCEFVLKEMRDLNDVIKKFLDVLGEKILDYKIFLSEDILRVNHLVSEIYEGLELQPLEQPQRKEGLFDGIDEIDRKLLGLLTKDSSSSLIELSKKMGNSVPIVRYRIKKLFTEGILVKYSTLVNTSKLGYSRYLCQIKLNRVDSEKIKILKNFISKNERITYAFLDAFTFSLVFLCSVKEIDKLDDLLRTLKRNFGELIQNQEYSIVKEQIKFNLFPKGLKKESIK